MTTVTEEKILYVGHHHDICCEAHAATVYPGEQLKRIEDAYPTSRCLYCLRKGESKR